MARHKIAARYSIEHKLSRRKRISKRNIYRSIFNEEKSSYNLKDSFSFPFKTVRSRIKNENLAANGRQSPMIAIESKLVTLVMCMGRIKRTLTISQVSLANDLIQKTETQKN